MQSGDKGRRLNFFLILFSSPIITELVNFVILDACWPHPEMWIWLPLAKTAQVCSGWLKTDETSINPILVIIHSIKNGHETHFLMNAFFPIPIYLINETQSHPLTLQCNYLNSDRSNKIVLPVDRSLINSNFNGRSNSVQSYRAHFELTTSCRRNINAPIELGHVHGIDCVCSWKSYTLCQRCFTIATAETQHRGVLINLDKLGPDR